MDKKEVSQLKHGLYRVTWKDGGSSLAAIGSMYNGDRWICCTNWTSDVGGKGTSAYGKAWDNIVSVELIEPNPREVVRITAEGISINGEFIYKKEKGMNIIEAWNKARNSMSNEATVSCRLGEFNKVTYSGSLRRVIELMLASNDSKLLFSNDWQPAKTKHKEESQFIYGFNVSPEFDSGINIPIGTKVYVTYEWEE